MKKACLIITGLLVLLVIISLFLTLFQKNIPLGNRLALIRIEGPIIDAKDAIDEIKEYTGDKSIKAIVLRVDSPGGAVAPSQEIYEEVKKAVAKKKVVVSMGSVAASGGYYISAPATKIIANPGTLTGSIGVIMEIPNIEKLMDKIGIRTEVIKSGRHKDIASAFRSMGKEEREILQGVMDNVHEQFIRAVAEGRKMKVEELRKIADGRIFTGEQAKTYGLVDELGTLEDAIKIAADLAGMKEEPEVVSKKDKLSVLDILRNTFPKEIADIFPTVKIKYLYSP
ncbi:MAG: sppA [Nitrospirae bacterium]|jgi:protease-4|nr:sppA [Nitrospirota bacterium]MBS1126168.1 sppA [Nitrospirota bacterium]